MFKRYLSFYFKLVLLSVFVVICIEEITREIHLISFFWIITEPVGFLVSVTLVMILLLFGTLFDQWIKYESYVVLILFKLSLLTFVNKMKILFRGDGVYLSDVYLFKEGFYIIEQNIWLTILAYIVLFVFMILLLNIFSKRKGNKSRAGTSLPIIPTSNFYSFSNTYNKFLPNKNRVTLSIITILLVILIAIPIDSSSNFFKYPLKHNVDRQNYYGFLTTFLIELKLPKLEIPEDYSKEKIYDIINKYNLSLSKSKEGIKETLSEKEAIIEKSDKKPDFNIVFVLNESFMLQEDLNIKAKRDATPYMRELFEKNNGNYMNVGVVGGGTAETEFEVLTGLSLRLLNEMEHSEPSVYINFLREETPSIANILNAYGYKTYGVHTNEGWFYKRDRAYPLLGFDEFRGIDKLNTNIINDIDGIVSDETLFNEIKEIIKKEDAPVFISSVSYQGHGFYDDIDFEDYNIQNDLTPADKKELNSYLTLMNRVDKNIHKFLIEINKIDEPTLVLFYTDHIPPLRNNLGARLKVNRGELTKVPYVIWSNFENEDNKDNLIKTEGEIVSKVKKNDSLLESYELTSFLLEFLELEYNQIIFDMHSNYMKTGKEDIREDFNFLIYDIISGNNYYKESLGEP